MIDTERSEALLECHPLSSGVALRQLGRHEELSSRHAALCDRLPDLGFVAVHRCRVDVPVADLERATNSVDGSSTTQLPRAEPEQRHPRTRAQLHGLPRNRPVDVAHIPILPFLTSSIS